MNVKQTINYCILKHPILYKDVNYEHSRAKVLDQLFFTNGNGYEWEDGELRDGSDTDVVSVIPEGYFDSVILSNEDESDRDMCKLLDIKFVPFELCSKDALNIYPICKYAKILNIPDDVKKDWLAAAYEACDLAYDYLTDPYKHCRNLYISDWMEEREYGKITKYLEEQMSYLATANDRIHELMWREDE